MDQERPRYRTSPGPQYVQHVRQVGTDIGGLEGARSIAIAAGASAPETPVDQIVDAVGEHPAVALETLTTGSESMAFPLPRGLREAG